MRQFLFLILTVFGMSICSAVEQETSLSMDDAVFFVETDVGSGVAFLMEDPTGTVWMVSSSSVFEGAEEYSIKNAKGNRISFPEHVMVASDRDLICFRTDFPTGLKNAASCNFEEEILTFSKCKDDGEDELITKLENKKFSLKSQKQKLEKEKLVWERLKASLEKADGWEKADTSFLESKIEAYDRKIEKVSEQQAAVDDEIAALEDKKKDRQDAADNGVRLGDGFLLKGNAVAIGPDRIEISALVNQYDCGGPIVNMSHEVVGVCTHLIKKSRLPRWVIEGTRFEDVRQFALKTDNVEWVPMTCRAYQKETDFIRENFDALEIFAQITESLSEEYFPRISVSTENKDVQEWLDRHNKLAEKYSAAKNEYHRSSEARKLNKYFKRNFGNDLEALVEMIEALEKDAGRVHRVSVPFYKERLTDLELFYANIRKRLERIVENI